LPYRPGVLDHEVESLLEAAGAVEAAGDARRARVRVSTVGEHLFVHSAYPTDDEQAVFLGPDSYRFAALIEAELQRSPPVPAARLVDIGTGAGVGAIVAASACRRLAVAGTDVNHEALRLARINAAAANVSLDLVACNLLDAVSGPLDIVTANPPYIVDGAGRLYRDGGGSLGADASLAMARAALERMGDGGRLILYTGSAIVAGEDRLREELGRLARAHGCTMRYRELDPDVFGEELERVAYHDVERIALVSAVLTRSA